MAMMKICPRCRTVHEYMEPCPNGCKAKAKAEADSYYDRTQRKNHEFYNSKDWLRLRRACNAKFDGLCLWSYVKHERIVPGSLSHHIIEINDDKARALDLDNLIYVSDTAHREIHALYKTDKAKTQQELFNIIEVWKSRQG